MSEAELGPLPAGRHGFSREQVAHHQRERLLAALAAALGEHGYGALTIGHIAEHARVSRRVFYENFESKEECLLAAFEVVSAHVRELVAGAVSTEEDWPRQAIAATVAALRFLASEPHLAWLCLVASSGAGPAVAARFREAVDGVVPFLELGRKQRPPGRPLPEATEEAVIGAVVSLLARKVAVGEAELLAELTSDCAVFVLSPYLGRDEALRLAQLAR